MIPNEVYMFRMLDKMSHIQYSMKFNIRKLYDDLRDYRILTTIFMILNKSIIKIS